MHRVLTHKNMKIPMKKKISGTPPSPLKKPILGGQKPKWADSPRKGVSQDFNFLHGDLTHKKPKIPMKKKIGGAPLAP